MSAHGYCVITAKVGALWLGIGKKLFVIFVMELEF